MIQKQTHIQIRAFMMLLVILAHAVHAQQVYEVDGTPGYNYYPHPISTPNRCRSPISSILLTVWLAFGSQMTIAMNVPIRAGVSLPAKMMGKTWTKRRANINDVHESTPTLILDKTSNLIYNYYYQRGPGLLKLRTVDAQRIFSAPQDWCEAQVIA